MRLCQNNGFNAYTRKSARVTRAQRALPTDSHPSSARVAGGTSSPAKAMSSGSGSGTLPEAASESSVTMGTSPEAGAHAETMSLFRVMATKVEGDSESRTGHTATKANEHTHSTDKSTCHGAQTIAEATPTSLAIVGVVVVVVVVAVVVVIVVVVVVAGAVAVVAVFVVAVVAVCLCAVYVLVVSCFARRPSKNGIWGFWVRSLLAVQLPQPQSTAATRQRS